LCSENLFSEIPRLAEIASGRDPTITMTAAGKGVRKRGIPDIRITNRFPTEQPLSYFRTSLVVSVSLTIRFSTQRGPHHELAAV
jgi:hypothetical protein